jgi:hypothetical protein
MIRDGIPVFVVRQEICMMDDMHRKSDSKDRMIAAARRLFRDHGYLGTALSDVIIDSAAPPPASPKNTSRAPAPPSSPPTPGAVCKERSSSAAYCAAQNRQSGDHAAGRHR